MTEAEEVAAQFPTAPSEPRASAPSDPPNVVATLRDLAAWKIIYNLDPCELKDLVARADADVQALRATLALYRHSSAAAATDVITAAARLAALAAWHLPEAVPGVCFDLPSLAATYGEALLSAVGTLEAMAGGAGALSTPDPLLHAEPVCDAALVALKSIPRRPFPTEQRVRLSDLYASLEALIALLVAAALGLMEEAEKADTAPPFLQPLPQRSLAGISALLPAAATAVTDTTVPARLLVSALQRDLLAPLAQAGAAAHAGDLRGIAGLAHGDVILSRLVGLLPPSVTRQPGCSQRQQLHATREELLTCLVAAVEGRPAPSPLPPSASDDVPASACPHPATYGVLDFIAALHDVGRGVQGSAFTPVQCVGELAAQGGDGGRAVQALRLATLAQRAP